MGGSISYDQQRIDMLEPKHFLCMFTQELKIPVLLRRVIGAEIEYLLKQRL